MLDRNKDMIIVNGANVYCSEVEAALSKHPLIVEIAVIGTPLPVEGEEVTAVVVLAPGSKLTIGQLQAFVQDRIAPHKIPTRMEIVESLARTSVGKIDKAAIRRPFWAGRTRMIN
ncbi:AMP-binding enzyme [Cohnella endophytica]|uniref:AMP-binding enzyme n=1 Tax=Cohnella endophytica TaxID=2419778 RepID=UPI0011C367A2|nr:hypothetical protein [Cohnella endophytica]